jgi:hypothetical protein
MTCPQCGYNPADVLKKRPFMGTVPDEDSIGCHASVTQANLRYSELDYVEELESSIRALKENAEDYEADILRLQKLVVKADRPVGSSDIWTEEDFALLAECQQTVRESAAALVTQQETKCNHNER